MTCVLVVNNNVRFQKHDSAKKISEDSKDNIVDQLNIENKPSILNEDYINKSRKSVSQEYKDQCFNQKGLIEINERESESEGGLMSNPDFQSSRLLSSTNRRADEDSNKTSSQLKEASSDKKITNAYKEIVNPTILPCRLDDKVTSDLTVIKEQIQGEGNQTTLRLSIDMLNFYKDDASASIEIQETEMPN